MRLLFRCLAAVIVLFVAMPVNASDDGNFRKWRFGAQVILTEPHGGLGNVSSTGLGYSPFFAERSLGKKNNMAFRLSQDFISFGAKDGWDAGSFGPILLDFLYRFKSNDVGVYIHAGTGLRRTFAEGPGAGWDDGWEVGGYWLIVYSGGMGYNFNRHIGIEARYSTQRNDEINSDFPPVSKPGNIQYMQLGISYRF
jgi:hypothetical protein